MSRKRRKSGKGMKSLKSGDKTTKGKEAPADKGKRLRRCRLIFRKEDTKGFIDAGSIV